MCVSDWFKPDLPQAQERRMDTPPPLKPVRPPGELEAPVSLAKTEGDAAKISTKRKQKLQVQKTQRGVKEFGAIDPTTTPSSPDGGSTTPGV